MCECLDLHIQLLLYRALMVELVRGPSRSHMVGNSLSLFILTSVHQLEEGYKDEYWDIIFCSAHVLLIFDLVIVSVLELASFPGLL